MDSPSLASDSCTCGLCLPEWLADGWRCYGTPPPCPICFEAGAAKAWYSNVANHSWENSDRCDAHEICWSCLQQYVENKVLDDGIWHIRCPGVGCCYHLVDEDVSAALHQSSRREETLQRHELLRGQTCGARLEELMAMAGSDPSQAWLLRECQVCPRCFVLARREDGCTHLVCRCGCDYCYGCGAPHDLRFDEARGCLCGDGDEDSDLDDDLPQFGLWLGKEKQHPCLLKKAERLTLERQRQSRANELWELERRELWELELAHGASGVLRWLDIGLDAGVAIGRGPEHIPQLGLPKWAEEEYDTDHWIAHTEYEFFCDFDEGTSARSQRQAHRRHKETKNVSQWSTGSQRQSHRQKKLRKVRRGKVTWE